MGVMKDFGCMQALKQANIDPLGNLSVKTFRDTGGSGQSYFWHGSGGSHFPGYNMFSCHMYRDLSAYASSDEISSYSEDSYAVNSIGSLTWTTNSFEYDEVNEYLKWNMVFAIANNTEEDISIGSIKFVKWLPTGERIPGWSWIVDGYSALAMAYYLEEPIIIQAGKTGEVVITLKIEEEVD